MFSPFLKICSLHCCCPTSFYSKMSNHRKKQGISHPAETGVKETGTPMECNTPAIHFGVLKLVLWFLSNDRADPMDWRGKLLAWLTAEKNYLTYLLKSILHHSSYRNHTSGPLPGESSFPAACLVSISGDCRWKWNAALPTGLTLKKKGLLREWKPSTNWELKNFSLAPHQEWDQQVGPTMTSPSLQSLQAPSGMPLSSQLSALPSYSQQTLPKAMRGHQSSPSGIISNHSHAQNFSLDTPLWTQPFTLQPIFVFPPEEAAFTPAQALQLACVQAAGLYLHITFKAFIWQAVWKMPECNINLHFSHHSPFLISVWECINKGLSHKVCIWAFLVFGGAELAPEPGAVTPSSCSTWKPVYSSDSPSQNSLFCLNIQSSGFLYPAFPTLSHQTVI